MYTLYCYIPCDLAGNFCAGYDLKALSEVETQILPGDPAKDEIGPMVCIYVLYIYTRDIFINLAIINKISLEPGDI